MKEKTYTKTSNKIQERVDSFTEKDEIASSILSCIASGENSYLRSSRKESANFDYLWIRQIEDTIPELGEIIKDPKKVTKEEENITPVELAKKTGPKSVRHLASHTEHIKKIDENGDVVPSKILSLSFDDDYMTYENKFIATLVKRLLYFVEIRYNFVNNYLPLNDYEIMMVKSKTVIDGMEVEVESKIKVKKVAVSGVMINQADLLRRIEKIRQYILYYYTSPFMKMFKNEKDVRNPIIQTNIIRKNPKYHKCYVLYKFLEQYQNLGCEYNVKDNYSEWNDREKDIANKLLMNTFLALNPSVTTDDGFKQEKTFKPKILKSLDEEMFVYGKITSNKPLEFIRVDEDYKKEWMRQFDNLNVHPTKVMKAYDIGTYELKKNLKGQFELAEELVKRDEKRKAEHEKKVLDIIAKREEEERIRKEKEEAERRRQELEIIEKARRELKRKAKADKIKIKKK